MRHHERVVKAAHEHRTPTCHHVREHAEELFLQVVLVNTIMIIESRLCAPADVKRGIDVRLRFDLRRQSVRYFDRYRGSSSFFHSQTKKDGLAHHHNHTDIHAAHRPFV